MADVQTEIKNPKHAESCIAKMQSLFENEVLCDLTLKVGDSRFKVHKLVLVSQTKYFENMLLEVNHKHSLQMVLERHIEAKQNLVELEEIDPVYFQKILRYFYYGSIMVSMKEIGEILKIADYFLVDTLKMYCTEYLTKRIDKQNCVSGFLLADRYKLKDKYRCQVLDFISKNIEEVSKTDDFCKLSQTQLIKILNYNSNNGCSEHLLNAIFQWIVHDKDNRNDSILDLVQILSTRGLKRSFLIENLLNEPLMRESFDCNKWLLDHIRERFTAKNNFCDDDANALFFTSVVQNISYSLNISSKKFTLLSPKPKDIRGFCVCSHKNNVFLLGGEYEEQAYNKSMKISSGKQEWEELNWEFGRRDAGACVLSNEIYIVGGYNIAQQTVSNAFHVCDMETGKQIRLRDMVRKRRYPALCTHGGSLYACCGNDGATNLDTIERYDPRVGHWEMYTTIPDLSGRVSAVIRDDKLLIYKTEIDGKFGYPYREQFIDFKNKCSNNFFTTIDRIPLWKFKHEDVTFHIHGFYVLSEWGRSKSGHTFTPEPHHDCPVIVPWKT